MLKEYVFTVGDREIIIEAEDEKKALHILIDKSWDLIDESAFIQLNGEIIEKTKLEGFLDFEDEED